MRWESHEILHKFMCREMEHGNDVVAWDFVEFPALLRLFHMFRFVSTSLDCLRKWEWKQHNNPLLMQLIRFPDEFMISFSFRDSSNRKHCCSVCTYLCLINCWFYGDLWWKIASFFQRCCCCCALEQFNVDRTLSNRWLCMEVIKVNGDWSRKVSASARIIILLSGHKNCLPRSLQWELNWNSSMHLTKKVFRSFFKSSTIPFKVIRSELNYVQLAQFGG